MKSSKILAIETSCDETAAAVFCSSKDVFSGRLLSSIVASQVALHAKTGGVVPEVAARAHIEKIIPVVDLALKRAKTRLSEISLIAVTCGPGLITSLRVGVDTARTLSAVLKTPVVAINHIEAHIYSPFLSSPLPLFTKEGVKKGGFFPAISLVVSGGHTELFLVRNWLSYKKIGQTLDDAAGEAFDKIARLLHLAYPGGPALAALAGKGNPEAIKFPRPMLASGDFNFSFSGLKTAVLYYLRDNSVSAATGYTLRANVAASAQAAIVDVLTAKTLAAAKKFRAKTVLVGGGVAANNLLRKKLNTLRHAANANLLFADKKFTGDNAAMIAFAGALHAQADKLTPLPRVKADASWELD